MRSPTSNYRLITLLLWWAAIFCFSAISLRAASLMISSTNLSSSCRFSVLAWKFVSAPVRQLSLFSSMGITASVSYVSRKGDSPVIECGVVWSSSAQLVLALSSLLRIPRWFGEVVTLRVFDRSEALFDV